MGLRGQWTGYGREAALALRPALTEIKGGDPLTPAMVVVPSNQAGVATRRLLASGAVGPVTDRGPGLAAVTFLTVYRLAELLGSADLAGQGRRPVSTAVIGAALRKVLSEDPGLFAPVATHPATEEALVDAYRELRDLPEATLAAVAASSRRAAEVVRVHRAARASLVDRWYDEEDLLVAAVAALDDSRTGLLMPTVVHLPQRLSLHGAALLRALGQRVDVTVLAGTTGVATADCEVTGSLTRLGLDDLVRDGSTRASPVSAGRTTIVTTSDADEEIRAAVRSVMDAVRDGTPLGRMAILYASPEPYARLAHDQLRAAGVATNGPSVVPLTNRLASRTLLGLLDWPEHGYRRWNLLAWLTGAPLRHEGRRVPATAWERVSRQAAVVAGPDDWDRLLANFADSRDNEAIPLEADPERPAWEADRAREEAQRARSLRTFALGLIADLQDAQSGPRTWGAHAAWARQRLTDLLGPPTKWTDWPMVEVKAEERLEQAIDRLAALEGVEGPVDLEVFTRTLRLVLEADQSRVGRLGEGVMVGSLAMGVGVDLDLVVLVGLAEGGAPAPISDDPLLADADRAAAGGELPLGRDRIDRQHRQLLASLAGAGTQVLTVPRGDLRTSSARVASRWVLDVASELSGERWYSGDLWSGRAPWLRHVPSFEAGIRTGAFPATEQEHHLARLLATNPTDRRLSDDPEPLIAHGADVIHARRSGRFTRFDGNLAGTPIPSPTTRATSASRLERWVACPFSHLLADILRVQEIDDPDERLSISPLDRGNLIHQVLEEFVNDTLGDPVVEWTPDHHARLRAIGERLCNDYEERGLTGHPLLWHGARRAILTDLDEALTQDSKHRRGSHLRPIAAELPFGMGGRPPVTMALDDRRTVRFRGKADRVDRSPDGDLAVIDYKSGRIGAFAKLCASDPVLSGAKLQLPIYAAAARAHVGLPDAPVHAEFRFVSAGANYKRIGYPVTDDVEAITGAVLGTIVRAIEAGVFPARPERSTTNTYRTCPYCDPDGLGTGDLRRQWEGKTDDPALADYVGLVEPRRVEEEVGE